MGKSNRTFIMGSEFTLNHGELLANQAPLATKS